MLLLLWMGFIFLMSTDFGASGGKPSNTIISTVKIHTGIDMNEKVGVFSINTFFRKNMHFLEFAVLGLLVLNVMKQYNIKHGYKLSVIFSALYAALDEVHQMYVESRTPLFTDALLDTCGAALALFIFYIVSSLKSN